MEEKAEDIGGQLSEAGREALIKRTGLGTFLLNPQCDRKKQPYSPSVLNWNNSK